jgi:hypothetical protein
MTCLKGLRVGGILCMKNGTILFFFISLTTSLYFFFHQETETLRDKVQGVQNQEERVELENFEFTEYDGSRVLRTIKGGQAFLFDPNRLEIQKGLEAHTPTSGRVEAQKARVIFATQGAMDFIATKPEVQDIWFYDQVIFLKDNQRMETSAAHYDPKKKEISSQVPSKLIQIGQGWIEGQKGFRFFLDREDLEMQGLVRGTIKGP